MTNRTAPVAARLLSEMLARALLYVQLEKALFKDMTDEFTAKVAKTLKKIRELLEVGFEYVCERDGLMFFRKRK